LAASSTVAVKHIAAVPAANQERKLSEFIALDFQANRKTRYLELAFRCSAS
jgi:hypothetical protein